MSFIKQVSVRPNSKRQQPFYFLPLGGVGEIGMNLALYGYDQQWIMADAGITFADHTLPGIDILLPDTHFIDARREHLLGIVLTHAHEDHIGALPYLWPRWHCPIYATPFTAQVVRRKLSEAGLTDVAIHEIPLGGQQQLGPFDLRLISLTHSIPESNALLIRTPSGTALHTGDWKLDPQPLVGTHYDVDALRALGDQPIDALICDSTNATVAGHSGSEAWVMETLQRLITDLPNRVVVSCFASNIARLHALGQIAKVTGRRIGLLGRALHAMYHNARACGYLNDMPPLVPEHDLGYLPRNEVLIICTGSQGEPRSALARLAAHEHPQLELEAGDHVIFSSRVIPGNELALSALKNRLALNSIHIITDSTSGVHVSGHPAQEELHQLFQWIRPHCLIPVHGEERHLRANAKLGQANGIKQTLVANNGAMIRLAPGPAAIVEQVRSGRIALDGQRLLALNSPILRTRKKLMEAGTIDVTLIMDKEGQLQASPHITSHGLLETRSEEKDQTLGTLQTMIVEQLDTLPPDSRQDESVLRYQISRLVMQWCVQKMGKRPHIEIHLIHLTD